MSPQIFQVQDGVGERLRDIKAKTRIKEKLGRIIYSKLSEFQSSESTPSWKRIILTFFLAIPSDLSSNLLPVYKRKYQNQVEERRHELDSLEKLLSFNSKFPKILAYSQA